GIYRESTDRELSIKHKLIKSKPYTSTGSTIIKDLSKTCQQIYTEEKQRIGSISSEEHERLSICVNTAKDATLK
ncbi:hypothetical protein AC249_AIPGENE5401, partial [Exaiptasia diaphana]